MVTQSSTINFPASWEKLAEKTKPKPKLRMLSALAHIEWGWSKQHLMRIYSAHFKSAINYAGFAWQASLSRTQRLALERQQNRALRIITGHTLTTPIEALYYEAGEERLLTDIKRNIATAVEKCLRLPPDHPRALAFNESIPQRICLKRKNWGIRAQEILNHLPEGIQHRRPLTYFDHPPWLSSPNLVIHSSLPGITGKNDSEERIIEAALKQIRSFVPYSTIYTDGSATAGLIRGGAGIVCTIGDPSQPIITDTLCCKGSEFTSSYGEELSAMEFAASFIVENFLSDETIVIGTDSQSLCTALSNHSRETGQIRATFARAQAKIIVQWIPGHSNIPGNEAADAAAKEAAALEHPYLPVSFKSARSVIKQHIKTPKTHKRIDQTYASYSAAREKEINSRPEQVDLARIRSGHNTKFQAYQHRLDNSKDPTCPLCQHKKHNVKHWLQCPGAAAARHSIYGEEMDDGLSLLTKWPRKAITLSKKTLLSRVLHQE